MWLWGQRQLACPTHSLATSTSVGRVWCCWWPNSLPISTCAPMQASRHDSAKVSCGGHHHACMVAQGIKERGQDRKGIQSLGRRSMSSHQRIAAWNSEGSILKLSPSDETKECQAAAWGEDTDKSLALSDVDEWLSICKQKVFQLTGQLLLMARGVGEWLHLDSLRCGYEVVEVFNRLFQMLVGNGTQAWHKRNKSTILLFWDQWGYV